MRNLVHTKADKEMQLYILQKDFQFDIKQKMSLILLEQECIQNSRMTENSVQ